MKLYDEKLDSPQTFNLVCIKERSKTAPPRQVVIKGYQRLLHVALFVMRFRCVGIHNYSAATSFFFKSLLPVRTHPNNQLDHKRIQPARTSSFKRRHETFD